VLSGASILCICRLIYYVSLFDDRSYRTLYTMLTFVDDDISIAPGEGSLFNNQDSEAFNNFVWFQVLSAN